MTLKELLGESYKEGMTEQEIDEALKNRKIVDLKGGNYVDKEKYEKAIQKQTSLEQELASLKESTKDYNDLLNFKNQTEQDKAKAETIQALKDGGFKDEFIDYALYQVENGKIEKGDNFAENIKKFLSENKQYGVEQNPPTPPTPTPTINTVMGGDGQKGNQPPVVAKSWNKDRNY